MIKKSIALFLIFITILCCQSVISDNPEDVHGTFGATYAGFMNVTSEYPPDDSIEIERPPVNLSANVSGNELDVYIYFYNMTPIIDTWDLVDSYINISSQRVEYTTLASYGVGDEFEWGNTNYIWSINVTSSSGVWKNYTFDYTTISQVDSEDARYDVNNNADDVNVFDLSMAWGHRTVGSYATYNGLFDVNNDNVVNVFDLSSIWGHRTV